MSRFFKYCMLLPALMLLSHNAHAQSTDQIRNSGLYYFGTGTGDNYRIARTNARADLAESISVHVKSSFEQVVIDTGDEVETFAKSAINTYSSTALNNFDERILHDADGLVEIMVYITREELQAAFSQREKMIHEFIDMAEKAREELRIADALRYNYWALMLARSHPDNTRLTYHFGGDTQQSVILRLDDRINSIFQFISITVASVVEQTAPPQKHINLNFFYRNLPIQDISYRYFTGDGRSALHSVSNGIGLATLDGAFARETNNIELYIEYEYINRTRLVREVEDILKDVNPMNFPQSRKRINIPATKQVPAETTAASRQTYATAATNILEYEMYRDAVNQVVEAIRSRQYADVSQLFTPTGYDIYNRLIRYGNVTVLDGHMDTLRILQVNNEVMVRAVPMAFAFRNNRERFVENVVFSFDLDGRINGLSYALSDIAIQDILSKPEAFGSEEDKYFLINFMENYKTAFALERIDFIDAIFDEYALIIVGNVVRRAAEPVENVAGMYGSLSEYEIEKIRMSKSVYMDRLRTLFRRNEFINIRFEESIVRKRQDDDHIYGIQIAQHYYSSTYADKGYLFLMIDMTDTLNPKIYVRSWQAERNPDGSIYGLEDFRF